MACGRGEEGRSDGGERDAMEMEARKMMMTFGCKNERATQERVQMHLILICFSFRFSTFFLNFGLRWAGSILWVGSRKDGPHRRIVGARASSSRLTRPFYILVFL